MFGATWMPAPTSASSGAASRIVTLCPRAPKVRVAATPPIPAPTIIVLRGILA